MSKSSGGTIVPRGQLGNISTPGVGPANVTPVCDVAMAMGKSSGGTIALHGELANISTAGSGPPNAIDAGNRPFNRHIQRNLGSYLFREE